MKFIKLFLFVFLAFLSLNVSTLKASEITDSVTITVTDDTPCANGANNPPSCTTCPDKQILVNGKCEDVPCTNGANNPPLCTTCPDKKVLVNGKCIELYLPIGAMMSSFGCKIEIGKNSCTTPLSWSVTNPIPGADTAVTNSYDSTFVTSSPKNVTVHYPSTLFYLYHDAKELKSLRMNATCDELTSVWDPSSNKCKASVITTEMKGSIEASDCIIKLGEKACSIPFSWEVVNPELVGKSAVTIPVDNQIGSGDKGSKTFSLLYGSTTLYLYNNSKELAKKVVTAKVDPNVCVWDSKEKICVNPPTDPNICLNGATNYPTCTTCPVLKTLVDGKCVAETDVDGGWSYWTPTRSSTCGDEGIQTRACTNPVPQGNGKKCVGPLTQTYINNLCPSLDMKAQFNGIDILAGKSVKYNSSVKVIWESNAYTRSCSCNYYDKKSVENNSCGGGVNSSFKTGPLKRNTTFEVSCEGDYGMKISKSLEVLVDDISANYIEQ